MQTIKTALNLIDVFFGTIWGLTLTEVLPLLTSGSTAVFTQVDSIIKVLFSLAGLVYLVVRIIHYYHMSKLNRDIKRLEIEQLKFKKDENITKRD
jgi:hypothetical protein